MSKKKSTPAKSEAAADFKVQWEWKDVGAIHPDPANPRIIKDRKFRALVKSIKTFPEMLQIRPIVIDETGKILGGDKRYKAAVEAKLTKVPVVLASNLTEAQKKEFIIRDNVSSGEWDDSLLKDWDKLLLKEWGVDLGADAEKEVGANCEYPLVPQFDEKYASVVIICETKSELAAIKSKLGILGKRQSYKQSYIGETNVARYKELKIK